jgi:hypothetical protein
MSPRPRLAEDAVEDFSQRERAALQREMEEVAAKLRRLGRPPPLTADEHLAKFEELDKTWTSMRSFDSRESGDSQRGGASASTTATASSGVHRSFFSQKSKRDLRAGAAAPAVFTGAIPDVDSWQHLASSPKSASSGSPGWRTRNSDETSSQLSSASGRIDRTGAQQYKIPQSFKRRQQLNAAAAL